MKRFLLRFALVTLTFGAFVTFAQSDTEPVEFAFTLGVETAGEPYAAEVWAEVELPSGETLRLPAYYDGERRFVVRTHAAEAGEYRLRQVLLTNDGLPREIAAATIIPRVTTVASPQSRPFVRLDPKDPRYFADSNGERYFPVGANLAWASNADVTGFYRDEFAAFAAAGLNWTRIWMCDWGGLNLDWLPAAVPDSPLPGRIDSTVAQRWDKIVHLAEDSGVYIQMVLQHHGQYSTGTNPDWDTNPWNAVNPRGFLETPGEFFTSPRARELTKRKYRYIVARWGYSPAVLAWELFNEVHWVDALQVEKDTAAVAAWHAEMAEYLRSIDAHHHLVTTSCDPATSPLYAAMDYLQPHLYAVNMLINVQRYDLAPAELSRPAFYGEFGQNHMAVPEAIKTAASHLVPLVWASIMGTGFYAAQPWEGHRLHVADQLSELGAVSRFVAQTHLSQRDDLQHFAPLVKCDSRTLLRVPAGHHWQPRPAATVTIPVDGRVNLDLAEIPNAIVGSPGSVADGFPNRVTFQINSPRPTTARLELGGAGTRGAAMRALLDDQPVGAHTWPAESSDDTGSTVSFPVPAGPHRIMVENTGGADWFILSAVEFDLDVPIIAATGKRAHNFLMLWLWHREGVYAVHPTVGPSAIVQIDDVPAGRWDVTWWNAVDGIPASPEIVEHPGGALSLATPRIARHAAVALERINPMQP